MREFEDVAIAFDRACRAARVPYAFVGGMAVLAWGQPRTTSDIDALLAVELAQVPTMSAALAGEGLRGSEADFRDAFADRSHVSVFDERSAFHVDVKIAFREDERRQVADAVDVPFRGAALRVARPEDTVAFKLLYGTPQDLADARSILVRQVKRLDEARLRGLARRLGVEEALERALDEAPGG
ncbi:MAG TPA: nucleotidyl transferase AbiEii/AbiGii toxin family protein [Candidatus Thermoplasmatota archaeon]|nr:nucleotidyl transferase AbiEii/AbiGii toxin family protein [Candidatus Thermoplasmatota archaeon]